MRGTKLSTLKFQSSGFQTMSQNISEDSYEHNRLSLETLRSYDKYADVSDEEGEAIIDDIIAMARLIIDHIKTTTK